MARYAHSVHFTRFLFLIFFFRFAVFGHSPCFIYRLNGGKINIEFDYCFDSGSFSYRLNNGVHFFVEVLCQDGRIYFTIALRRFGDDFSGFFTCFGDISELLFI